MADRLIQGQVTRAQEAEDHYVLKREMSSLKKGESEAKEQLAKTKEELDILKAKVRDVSCKHFAALISLRFLSSKDRRS